MDLFLLKGQPFAIVVLHNILLVILTAELCLDRITIFCNNGRFLAIFINHIQWVFLENSSLLLILVKDVLEREYLVLANVHDILELDHGEWDFDLGALLELRELLVEVCSSLVIFLKDFFIFDVIR